MYNIEMLTSKQRSVTVTSVTEDMMISRGLMVVVDGMGRAGKVQ